MINDEVKEPVENNEVIENIDLSVFNKKKFSINGNPDQIIELDTSDLNILQRIKDQYPVLEKLSKDVSDKVPNADGLTDEQLLNTAADTLKDIDKRMRECIDIIFDSPVSDICVPSGSMYDPVNGKFRFEHLIDVLISLYNDNLSKEVKKIQSRVSKHTSKYAR